MVRRRAPTILEQHDKLRCAATLHLLHAICLAAAPVRGSGEVGFHRRSGAQRRSPLVVRSRLPELRCRARPIRRPSEAHTLPAQHIRPHHVGLPLVRRRPHHPRRQRLEPLVVPPLRLGHLGARLQCQPGEGRGRGLCLAHITERSLQLHHPYEPVTSRCVLAHQSFRNDCAADRCCCVQG